MQRLAARRRCRADAMEQVATHYLWWIVALLLIGGEVILPGYFMLWIGIAAAAMFQFFYAWNDYYGPLLYTSENENAWTLSLGLASFRSLHHVDWNLVYAATMLTLVPVVVLFFFAQKAFVQGVTLTGVKG